MYHMFKIKKNDFFGKFSKCRQQFHTEKRKKLTKKCRATPPKIGTHTPQMALHQMAPNSHATKLDGGGMRFSYIASELVNVEAFKSCFGVKRIKITT